ncbi:MAG: hypothetical protein L0287_28560 [Anaerolineae bacterium]|nr:hypothetical protein [Anaerolineae bacterium]
METLQERGIDTIMKVVFYASDKPREHAIANALAEGVRAKGDEFEMRRTADYGEDEEGNDLKWPGPSPDTDVACMFGVKGRSRQILEDHVNIGKSTLYFDKGLTRHKGGEAGHTLYSRVYVNASHPAAYMMHEPRRSDRWDRLDVKIAKACREPGSGHVLICASSGKYHDFNRMPPPDLWGSGLISQLKKKTDKHLIWRPKPASRTIEIDPNGKKVVYKISALPGASFSDGAATIQDALRGCEVLITHGATAAVDAIVAGTPAICLGKCAASPVCSDTIDDVNDAPFPKNELRRQWLYNLAYCQWANDELRSGYAWEYLRLEIERQRQRKGR